MEISGVPCDVGFVPSQIEDQGLFARGTATSRTAYAAVSPLKSKFYLITLQ